MLPGGFLALLAGDSLGKAEKLLLALCPGPRQSPELRRPFPASGSAPPGRETTVLLKRLQSSLVLVGNASVSFSRSSFQRVLILSKVSTQRDTWQLIPDPKFHLIPTGPEQAQQALGVLGSTSALIQTRIFQAQPPFPAQLLPQVWSSAQAHPSREPGDIWDACLPSS